jgi:hypothetical protein
MISWIPLESSKFMTMYLSSFGKQRIDAQIDVERRTDQQTLYFAIDRRETQTSIAEAVYVFER